MHTDDLLVSQPDSGEQALEIADTLVRSGAIDIIVVDSVAALAPRAEARRRDGRRARRAPGAADEPGAAQAHRHDLQVQHLVIFINQIREKIGVMFGNPETTTGGHALKFYASVRLDIRRVAAIKDGDEVVGNRMRVKVVKNKIAAPFRRPSSTSCMAPAFPRSAICSISASSPRSRRSRAPGSPTARSHRPGPREFRAVPQGQPDIANKIEAQVRANSGVVAEAIMAGEKEEDDDGEDAAAEA